MATKPLTLPRPWATLANYDTGPFIGQPMKVNPGVGIAASGHRPGAAFPTPAEYENFQQNQITAVWIPWVNAGSFTGAADAHLVETAATGRSALVGLDLNDAVNETVLNVTGVNTLAPAVLVDSSAGGGSAYQAIVAPGSVAYTTDIGAGPGVGYQVNYTGALVGAAGLQVTGDAASKCDGVQVTLAGTVAGSGVTVTSASPEPLLNIIGSGVTTGFALETTGTNGLDITPKSLSTGITTRSGSTSGVALDAILVNTGGSAITTSMPVGATGGAIAVEANARGSGTAVDASSINGFAGVFESTGTTTCVTIDAAVGIGAIIRSNGSGGSGNFALQVQGDVTSPILGVLNIVTQNARPTTGLTGHTTVIDAPSLKLGLCGGNSDNTWRSYWHTSNGYACAYGSLSNTSTLGGIGVWRVVGTITTSSVGNELKVASSTVLLRVSMTPRAVTAAATGPTLGVLVEDTTAGSTIYQRVGTGTGDTSGFKMDDNTNIWQNSIVFMIPVVVPAIGTRSYRLSITTSSVTEIRVRDVTMDFVGTVD